MSGAEKFRGEKVEINDAGEQRGGADVGESENERRRRSEGDAEEEDGDAERDEEEGKIRAVGRLQFRSVKRLGEITKTFRRRLGGARSRRS